MEKICRELSQKLRSDKASRKAKIKIRKRGRRKSKTQGIGEPTKRRGSLS
jgi:hypothetical protein